MKILTIGRRSENDIVVKSDLASREHARIYEIEPGKYEIEDLNSSNGTFVNGRRVVGKRAITPKDRVVIVTTVISDWYEKIISKHDDSVDKMPEKVSNEIPQNDSVFYNFKKDTEKFFADHSKTINQLIIQLKESRCFVRSQHLSKQYSEELFDVLLDQYQTDCAQIVGVLNDIERECVFLSEEYNEDIKKLNNTYQYRLVTQHSDVEMVASIKEVENRKELYLHLYEQIKRQVISDVSSVIETFYYKNPPFYPNRFELATADSEVWSEQKVLVQDIQNTMYLGEDVLNFVLFQENVPLKIRTYVHTLCGGDLMFVYGEQQRKTCYDVVNTLVCRMMMSAPNGGVHVHMVDFHEMDGTGNVFKNLNKNIFQVITRSDDFSRQIAKLSIHVENIIQNLLKGDISNLSEYNKEKSNKESFHVLILKDVPIGYGGEVWLRLADIMRNGPRAGVSVIVMVNDGAVNGSEDMLKRFSNLQNAIKGVHCETVNLITQEESSGYSVKNHWLEYDILSKDSMDNVVKYVNQTMEVKTDTVLNYTDYMLPSKEWWTGQSANRIDLPFGMSSDMKTTSLQITQESGQNSAVVIGIPGSGKSVFLHTIIASAVTHYSPKELQLYLLDFSGVEFNVYAKHNLPHARVIAPEAEREFGLSVLRELKEEGARRMTLCRENEVTSIVQYRKKNPNALMPRLFVIIDEFQKIFEIDNDNISKEANSIIHIIIQEYRKFGINLILATQKIPSSSVLPKDLIANRVVFKSAPNDFAALIPNYQGNVMPNLKTGQCIYNAESGAAYANKQAQGFFLPLNEIEKLVDDLCIKAKDQGYEKNNLLVFRGNDLPDFKERRLPKKYMTTQELPNEVPVSFGQSISISETDVCAVLRKETSNNILVIGGEKDVAQNILLHASLSTTLFHTEDSARFYLFNFIRPTDPQYSLPAENFAGMPFPVTIIEKVSEVKSVLSEVKNEIDARKEDNTRKLSHIYLSFFAFQLATVFEKGGRTGTSTSEEGQLLEYILRQGPAMGVFTMLQVDKLDNLLRIGSVVPCFTYRVVLQVSSENESIKLMNNSSVANRLYVINRPSSKYRAYYFDQDRNIMIKFKPYK
ncbi:MAG: FHA domain-containing protein [Bacteroidales bacterium]|nr:FHA domain-containing protein [Bacteroidales bacterium]